MVDESAGITEKELENFREQTKQGLFCMIFFEKFQMTKSFKLEKEFKKDEESLEQRIIFKKPDKSKTNDDQSSSTTFQTTKKATKLEANFKNSNLLNKDRIKRVKNTSLLSFDNDDDDDDEDQ